MFEIMWYIEYNDLNFFGVIPLKAKRLICTVAAAIMSLSLTACGTGSEKASDIPAFFMLENSPEVIFEKPMSEIIGRYNEEYTASFSPSAEYGEIIPFVGKYLTYTLSTKDGDKMMTSPLYGLCTDDGRVIVDPVYSKASRYELDNGSCFYELYIDSGIKGRKGRRIAVAHDGSWMLDLGLTTSYKGISGDGLIAFERTRTVTKEKLYYYYDFYDYNGNKAFTYEPVQNKNERASSTVAAFADGLAAVNQTVYSADGSVEYTEAYYIDKTGKMVIGSLSVAGTFNKGLAVVADANGLCGVINTSGEYVIQPTFLNIDYNAELGIFSCDGDGVYQIYNTSNELLKTIFCKNSSVRVFGDEKLIFEKKSRITDKSEFFYLDTEEPFTYPGTGQFPTEYIGSGIYLCNYSGVGYFFDENGASIVTCENFGGIIANSGSYIVAHSKSKDKLVFIDILAKRILNTVEAEYSDGIADKGIFLIKSNNTYSVYNAVSGQTLITDCTYSEITRSSGKALIVTVKDGRITAYDEAFNTVMAFSDGGAK